VAAAAAPRALQRGLAGEAAALGQWRRHKLRATLVAALALLVLWALAQRRGDLAGTA
jgi:hypothetical protein